MEGGSELHSTPGPGPGGEAPAAYPEVALARVDKLSADECAGPAVADEPDARRKPGGAVAIADAAGSNSDSPEPTFAISSKET